MEIIFNWNNSFTWRCDTACCACWITAMILDKCESRQARCTSSCIAWRTRIRALFIRKTYKIIKREVSESKWLEYQVCHDIPFSHSKWLIQGILIQNDTERNCERRCSVRCIEINREYWIQLVFISTNVRGSTSWIRIRCGNTIDFDDRQFTVIPRVVLHH